MNCWYLFYICTHDLQCRRRSSSSLCVFEYEDPEAHRATQAVESVMAKRVNGRARANLQMHIIAYAIE